MLEQGGIEQLAARHRRDEPASAAHVRCGIRRFADRICADAAIAAREAAADGHVAAGASTSRSRAASAACAGSTRCSGRATGWRRRACGAMRRPATLPSSMRFELAYRPPYDWESMLGFLARTRHRGRRARRCRARIAARWRSRIAAGARTAGSPSRHAPRRQALCVDVSASLARAVPAVLSRVRHAFDLACDPGDRSPRALGALAEARPGLRVPGTCDGFELAVRAVIGQQISVARRANDARPAGRARSERRSMATVPAGLAHLFPIARTRLPRARPTTCARSG